MLDQSSSKFGHNVCNLSEEDVLIDSGLLCIQGDFRKLNMNDHSTLFGLKSRSVNDNEIAFDIVHVARYLDRRFFSTIRDLVRPGGVVLFHQFLVRH